LHPYLLGLEATADSGRMFYDFGNKKRRWRCTLLVESPVRSARFRRLCVPYARIALNMRTRLAHNPLVSVRTLKGG